MSSYNLRNADNFVIPLVNSELTRNSFFPSTISAWNILPADTRSSDTLTSFRHSINRNKPIANKYFLLGSRKYQIILARIRMNCSILKADLYRNHVTDSPKCIHCNMNEDAFHFFFQCNHYLIYRAILHAVVLEYGPFTLRTILYGIGDQRDEQNLIIFNAVSNFINASHRFD